MARIDGTAGDDILHGTSLADEIYGYDGIDSLYGDDGNDWLIGESRGASRSPAATASTLSVTRAVP